jgi:hypothetical protein
LEWKRFRRFGQIDRFAVEHAAQAKRAEPFAGLIIRVAPTQIFIWWRLIALGVLTDET